MPGSLAQNSGPDLWISGADFWKAQMRSYFSRSAGGIAAWFSWVIGWQVPSSQHLENCCEKRNRPEGPPQLQGAGLGNSGVWDGFGVFMD